MFRDAGTYFFLFSYHLFKIVYIDWQLLLLLFYDPPLVDLLERKVQIYPVQTHFNMGWEWHN